MQSATEASEAALDGTHHQWNCRTVHAFQLQHCISEAGFCPGGIHASGISRKGGSGRCDSDVRVRRDLCDSADVDSRRDPADSLFGRGDRFSFADRRTILSSDSCWRVGVDWDLPVRRPVARTRSTEETACVARAWQISSLHENGACCEMLNQIM